MAHESRVYVLDLRAEGSSTRAAGSALGTELLRLRREGNASFVFAGEHVMTDPETRAAMQRQVNNCSLADQVRAEIAAKGDAGR